MKSLLIIATMFWGLHSTAADVNIPVMDILKAQGLFNQEVGTYALDWKVGDSTQHNINMGFISGKMDSRVREETPEGFWMDQDMNMGFLGEQKVEIHINKHTGEILEIRVNGQKQNIPDQGNQEIVDMQEASIKVPAGTFDCVYLKIKDTSNNQISQAWLNPQVVPMMGLIKTIQPGQFGEVTVELTGFKKM